MIASLLLSAALADDLNVDSKITEVVVYADRARVTRTASVDIPAGRTDLLFDGLPLSLMPASLSAEGEGTAAAVLTGIDVRTTRGVVDLDAQIAAAKAERRVHEDNIRVQRDIVARVKADIAFETSLKPTAPGKLSEPLFLADDAATQLGTMSKQIGTDLVALYKEERTAEQVIAAEQKEIDRIDRDLSVLGQGTPAAQNVAVGLDAPHAGHVTVRLEYIVSSAQWIPHWDARYRPADGKVRLDLSGEVMQTTGESWKDVKLVLSTARASESTAPPELTPFYLTEVYGGGYQAAAAASDRATTVEFTSPSREDVPADGTRRRVFVSSLDLAGTIEHQVVPRRVEAAWLTARVTNTAEYALLPGAMSSYMGTAYVGEGTLPMTAPGQQVSLSFGVDDRVRVKRTRVETVASEAKALGNRDHQKYGWKMTITNRTGKSIALKVIDRVPVSREQAFTVDTTLTPTTTIPSDGVFTWTMDLADGKSQDFIASYDVSWPQGDAPVLME